MRCSVPTSRGPGFGRMGTTGQHPRDTHQAWPLPQRTSSRHARSCRLCRSLAAPATEPDGELLVELCVAGVRFEAAMILRKVTVSTRNVRQWQPEVGHFEVDALELAGGDANDGVTLVIQQNLAPHHGRIAAELIPRQNAWLRTTTGIGAPVIRSSSAQKAGQGPVEFQAVRSNGADESPHCSPVDSVQSTDVTEIVPRKACGSARGLGERLEVSGAEFCTTRPVGP